MANSVSPRNGPLPVYNHACFELRLPQIKIGMHVEVVPPPKFFLYFESSNPSSWEAVDWF